MSERELSLAYDDAYFDAMEAAVERSAEVVVPLLLDLVHPASAVDVGCGRGTWLSVLKRHGVARVLGIDGSHVPSERLALEQDEFRAADLSEPLHISKSYDLGLCLEVVEHLPPAAGERLVEELAGAAPAVLFSAAVPGQGGREHVNEQWPEHWEGVFARHGFLRLDPFRRVICYDTQVKWWYRQNLLLYVSKDLAAGHGKLRREADLAREVGLEWVHTSVLSHYLRQRSFRGVLEELPGAFRTSLRKHLSRARR